MTKRTSTWVLMCGLGLSSCRPQPTGEASEPNALPPRAKAPASEPPAPQGQAPSDEPTIVLSPVIPHDVAVGKQLDLPGLQHDFDVLSWNSFIALNWPPAADGSGDPERKPGEHADNPTVWEGWQASQDVFLPGGQTPVWGQRSVPSECGAKLDAGVRLVTQIGKTPNLLEESVEPFDTGPLIDQNGRFVRFEILVNRTMFEYIVANELYSRAGQRRFAQPVVFPCGEAGGSEGAVMVKAAWRVLADHDDATRFHVAEALVYTPASRTTKASCKHERLGLVGFHIAHKTDSAAQWVWSTFEQEDNAPTQRDVESKRFAKRYNFFDPNCRHCPLNTPPPRPWNPNKTAEPTQVMRVDVLPEFASTSAANLDVQAKALFAGVSPASVWQHYRLVSTQWPTNTGSDCKALPADPNGTPAPQFLANTTLETYIQGTTPNTSSSCIGCHKNAATTAGTDSDFTYLLERAM